MKETTMKKLLLIINPKSGKQTIKNSLFGIIQSFSEKGFEVTVRLTEYRNHAKELACGASDYDIIVCAGGDGTFNEAVSGIIEGNNKTPIGYIPCGSTNDFANTMSIPKKHLEAAEIISLDNLKQLDIGEFNDRHFSYVASFGAFTKTSYSTSQAFKNTLGHLAYILQGIKDIPSIKSEHIKVTLSDGEIIEGEFIFGAVSNSTSVGGVITLDEKVVSMNDGKFELLMVKTPKNALDLNKCINAVLSHKYDSEMLIFRNVDEITVETEKQLDWSLDGEKAETNGIVRIKNLHRAISVSLSTDTDSKLIE